MITSSSRTSSSLEVRIPYPIPPHKLDPDAVDIVRRLVRYGHQAYFVGGCIRDLHQGLPPKDFDLVTSARPNQIKKLFRNCRVIGRRFRLAHIHVHGKIIEVSTFRGMGSDAEPLGGRRGGISDNVFGTAEEDAMRRDFTINGLYYDVDSEEIIDFVGGFTDLRRHVIRCIGDPELRIEEDPVRMIRALKLAAKVNFMLDPPLAQAMHDHRRMIRESSPARILEELFKILGSGAASRTFELLAEYRLLEHLVPEVSRAMPAGHLAEAAIGYRFLDALDAADRGLRIHSNPVLMGALFLPVLDPAGKAIGLEDATRVHEVVPPDEAEEDDAGAAVEAGSVDAERDVVPPAPPEATEGGRPLTIEPERDREPEFDRDPDRGRDRDRGDWRGRDRERESWPGRSHLQLSLEASRLVRNSQIMRNLPRRDLHQLGQILALQRRLATATRQQVPRLTRKSGFADAVRLFAIACTALGVEPNSLLIWRPYLERAPRVEHHRDENGRPGFGEHDADELDFEAQFDEEDAELAEMLFPGDSGRRRRGRRRHR